MIPKFLVWATGWRNDIYGDGKTTLRATDIFSCRKLTGLKGYRLRDGKCGGLEQSDESG